jgi:YD repeat-containing protein
VFYEYDDTGSLVKLRQETDGGINLISDTYTYDINGNMTKIVRKDGTYTVYTYDKADQLLSERDYNAASVPTRSVDYTYDEIGNRVAKSKGC